MDKPEQSFILHICETLSRCSQFGKNLNIDAVCFFPQVYAPVLLNFQLYRLEIISTTFENIWNSI